MFAITLAALLIMLVSLSGVAFTARNLSEFMERNLSVLVSFSAGVFLVISYGLSVEAVTHASGPLVGLLWIAAGVIMITVLFQLLPSFHHHHDEHSETHRHSPLDARRILISDGIHNLTDGIVLAAAFAVSLPLGIFATASIVLHEVVQEVSEFFVLRQAGYSVRQAIAYNFALSSTILIGAIGGYFMLDIFERIEVPLLGIAAGALLSVVVHDLIPHSVRTAHGTERRVRHILSFIIGVLLMLSINAIVGHVHEEDDHILPHDATADRA